MCRFQRGFNANDILLAIREAPSLFTDILLYKEKKVTARDMSKLFDTTVFSEPGSNSYNAEVQRRAWLEDFFIEVERK